MLTAILTHINCFVMKRGLFKCFIEMLNVIKQNQSFIDHMANVYKIWRITQLHQNLLGSRLNMGKNNEYFREINDLILLEFLEIKTS